MFHQYKACYRSGRLVGAVYIGLVAGLGWLLIMALIIPYIYQVIKGASFCWNSNKLILVCCQWFFCFSITSVLRLLQFSFGQVLYSVKWVLYSVKYYNCCLIGHHHRQNIIVSLCLNENHLATNKVTSWGLNFYAHSRFQIPQFWFVLDLFPFPG